jgi:hypothetical protein
MLVKRVMYTSRKWTGLIISLLILLPGIVFSQQNKPMITIDKVIDAAQKAYGPDDLLVKGSLYVPDHPEAEGNPYFQEEEWTECLIVIKGKSFTIDSKAPINLEVDGESLGHSPFIFEGIPQFSGLGPEISLINKTFKFRNVRLCTTTVGQ